MRRGNDSCGLGLAAGAMLQKMVQRVRWIGLKGSRDARIIVFDPGLITILHRLTAPQNSLSHVYAMIPWRQRKFAERSMILQRGAAISRNEGIRSDSQAIIYHVSAC